MHDAALTPTQRVQLGVVYGALAHLLPVEGRDYTVDIRFDNGKMDLKMHGITPFGAQWVEHCRQQLPALLGKGNNDYARAGMDAGTMPVS